MPGFSTNDTFKIFIGKIPEKTAAQDIKPLFEKYGKVVECDVVKNYGFVVSIDPVRTDNPNPIGNFRPKLAHSTEVPLND